MARRRHGASLNHTTSTSVEERRYLAPLLVMLVVVGMIYAAAVKLLDPATLPVNTVRIDSPLAQVKPQQLRDVIGSHVTSGFLRVDVERIRTELEAMPWVKRASVRRTWPDRLVVRVEEQQPMARWAGGGLVNAEGEMFRPGQDEAWTDLPLLRGPRNTERVMTRALVDMHELLAPLGLRVSHLTLNERRSWDLLLDNGLRLGLGKADLSLRLQRFVRVYAEELQPRLHAIDSVDLRYTNGFAVRWRDGQSPAAA